MGSVKDLTIIKKPTENSFGEGVFSFTDDYSVFDYGKMPDEIKGKGESLCRMAVYNFQEVEKLGIKTHFKEFIEPNKMKVKLVRVLYPQKGEIKKGVGNYLIPLEIMFRNSLPEGSSLLKRFEKGLVKPQDFGLDKIPKPNELLEKPILDVSTKLEPTDRYLKWDEAAELACLEDYELEKVQEIALEINDYLNEKAESIGLEHADGKIELAFGPKREIIVVDVFGTLDENRFLYDGVHLSKQVLRDYYKKTEWYKKLEDAKSANKPKDAWPKPSKLPKELIEIVENMYKSTCEAWIGKKIWGAPSIEDVVEEYKAFVDELE